MTNSTAEATTPATPLQALAIEPFAYVDVLETSADLGFPRDPSKAKAALRGLPLGLHPLYLTAPVAAAPTTEDSSAVRASTPAAPGIDLERIVPPQWLSDQIGGIFDDLSSGQAWRMGFNECRVRMQLLIEQARGLTLTQASPKAGAPGIDPADPWRGLYTLELMPKLDGVGGYHVVHPDVPEWPDDEERSIEPLIRAQGFALKVVGDEYPDEEYSPGHEFDTCAWLANWKPEPPAGEGWRLVMVQDTEDGPAALYVRPLALIDASPKGGSTDAQDAARYRWLRNEYDPSVHDDERYSLLSIGGTDLDFAIDSMLQATSAEVGA